jgi:hypothetical protein
MANPVGRPPINVLAQLRAIIRNPATTERELGFLEGQIALMFEDRAANCEEPEPRKRRTKAEMAADAAEQPQTLLTGD